MLPPFALMIETIWQLEWRLNNKPADGCEIFFSVFFLAERFRLLNWQLYLPLTLVWTVVFRVDSHDSKIMGRGKSHMPLKCVNSHKTEFVLASGQTDNFQKKKLLTFRLKFRIFFLRFYCLLVTQSQILFHFVHRSTCLSNLRKLRLRINYID